MSSRADIESATIDHPYALPFFYEGSLQAYEEQAIAEGRAYIAEPPHFKVGDFLQYVLVVDTAVVEVIATTPHTITVRDTKEGELMETVDTMIAYTEAVSDPNGKVRTLRRRKDGTYRPYQGAKFLYYARTKGGKPVSRRDWGD